MVKLVLGKACWLLCGVLVFANSACNAATPYRTYNFNFTASAEQPKAWSPIFADYNQACAVEGLNASVSQVPGKNVHGWYFSVSNRADDIYFGLKGLLTGLAKSQLFKAEWEVQYATQTGKGCFGVGGSPGESVWLKAGAGAYEPSVSYAGGTWRFNNVAKGEQASSGPQGTVLGTVGVVGGDCGELGPAAPWIINTLKGTYVPPRCGGTPTTDSPAKPVATDTGAGADATGSGTGAPLTPRCVVDKKYDIKSSSKGELWVLVGGESGFEGINRIYITAIKLKLYKA